MVAGLKPIHVMALAAVAGAVLYAMRNNAAETGAGIASAGVDFVAGVFVGGVETIGENFGIPRTNLEKGQAELAAGDYWNASFDLPAGDFISGVWNKLTN